MAITNVAKTSFYNFRSAILPITLCAIPLAIEAGKFIHTCWKDPGAVKRNVLELKQKVCNAFQQQPNEDQEQFRKRFKKNILLTVLALTVLAAAAACPFFVLPAAFAIPAALAGIHAVGLAIKYIYKNPDIIGKVKNYLKDAFTRRPEESVEKFHARRNDAIKRIVGYTLLFAATVTAICFASHIALLMAKVESVWSLSSVLPMQTPLVVFLEYLTVGALHAVQAVRHWKKGNKSRAVFHMACTLLSIVFPLGYFFESAHGMRLHHSFIGLLLQLAPWRCVRVFGSVVTFDSSLYFISDKRGYLDGKKAFHSYDFMNTVVHKMPFVLGCLTGLALIEKITDYLRKPRKLRKTKKSQVVQQHSKVVLELKEKISNSSKEHHRAPEKIENMKLRSLTYT